MDLQFSIKDDDIRKKAQTITDQILNTYSALVSFYCSNKFLKKHFQDYSKKLQLKIQIKDLKQPTVNIDSQVSSITDKLLNLASAQDCNHPLSEHLVPDTPADRSGFALRLPSFSLPSLRPPSLRLPSFRSSSSTNTSRASISPRATTSRATAELTTFGDQQEDEQPRGKQSSLLNKLASGFRSPKTTSASTAPPNVYAPPIPTGSTTNTPDSSNPSTIATIATIATTQPSSTEDIYYLTPNNSILHFKIYKNDLQYPDKIVIRDTGYITMSGNTGTFIEENISKKKIPEIDLLFVGGRGYSLTFILNQDQFLSLQTAAQNNKQWTLIPTASTPDITFPGTWHSDEASAKSYIALHASDSASPAAKPPPQSIAEWNSKNYRVDIEPKSGTGGGGKNRIIIFSDDGLRFAWGKDKPNVTKRANTNISESKVDFPNQVILIDGKIKIDDVIKSQYRKNVCSDNDLCILVEGYTVTGTSEKAWVFTFSTDDEKNMFFRVLNDLCDNCVDKNRKKIRDDISKKNKADKQRMMNPLGVQGTSAKDSSPTSNNLRVIDDTEQNDSTTTSRLSSFGIGSILKSEEKIPAPLKQENVFMSADMHGILNLTPYDETQLTFDYNISRQEIQNIIIDKKIEERQQLIKILENRKKEAKLQIERDKKDKQEENERIQKKAQKKRAKDVIERYQREPGLGVTYSGVDVDALLRKSSPGYSGRGYYGSIAGGKRKRNTRKKTHSYRKNKRTKRNKNKKNKNKKNKNKNPKNN
jgi:hypothetical protein